MARLHDRVALITGGGRGIGRPIAEALAREGACVAVTARTAAELDDVVAAVTAAGGRAVALRADLAERDAPARLVRELTEKLGPADVLVNNAGVGSSSNPK